MSLERGVTSPELKKIPNIFSTLIVDDEPKFAAYTEAALQTALEPTSFSSAFIHTAKNVMDMFQKAFTGTNGNQMDVVLLDHKYVENYKLWKPEYKQLLQFAQQAGVDFTHYKIPDRGGSHWGGIMPEDLYSSNSVHFAMLLRIMGFDGSIFAVSHEPPEPEYIIREVANLAAVVPAYDPVFPINGTAQKDNLGRARYGVSYGRLHQGELSWKYGYFEKGLQADAMRGLFTAQ